MRRRDIAFSMTTSIAQLSPRAEIKGRSDSLQQPVLAIGNSAALVLPYHRTSSSAVTFGLLKNSKRTSVH